MPFISSDKIEKIKEQILFFLFTNYPKSFFTKEISQEIARDEEFTKKILIDLEKNHFVIKINKNSFGRDYKKRIKWRLSNSLYEIYKEKSSNIS
ncbi:MAG: hypothetical protein QW273_00235 [Candidatus Pacearchaeota archaeon]